MAGTALSIHGLIAVASTTYAKNLDPSTVLAPLGEPVSIDGELVDYFSYRNPSWQRIGALVDAGNRLQLRMSFQSRRSVVAEMLSQVGLAEEKTR
jgi:hypothetical protein